MAYELPIKEGEVRIVIKIEDINVEEENSAKEFVSSTDDEINLFLNLVDLDIKTIDNEGFRLLNTSEENSMLESLSLEKESIWFDVDMSAMSDLLNNTIQFSIVGKYPKHINYFIKALNYKIEWLQYDKQKDTISTVSVTKRNFTQSRNDSTVKYSLEDVAKCAELLSRAIKKIDLRTGSSYVRINTDVVNFDPLLVVMAEKLGYQLEVLDENTIKEIHKEGRKATHIISLIINY